MLTHCLGRNFETIRIPRSSDLSSLELAPLGAPSLRQVLSWSLLSGDFCVPLPFYPCDGHSAASGALLLSLCSAGSAQHRGVYFVLRVVIQYCCCGFAACSLLLWAAGSFLSLCVLPSSPPPTHCLLWFYRTFSFFKAALVFSSPGVPCPRMSSAALRLPLLGGVWNPGSGAGRAGCCVAPTAPRPLQWAELGPARVCQHTCTCVTFLCLSTKPECVLIRWTPVPLTFSFSHF